MPKNRPYTKNRRGKKSRKSFSKRGKKRGKGKSLRTYTMARGGIRL